MVRTTGDAAVETGHLQPPRPVEMGGELNSNFEAGARVYPRNLGALGYSKDRLVTLPLRDNDGSRERRGYLRALKRADCRSIPASYPKAEESGLRRSARRRWWGRLIRTFGLDCRAFFAGDGWRWARCGVPAARWAAPKTRRH